MITVRGRVVRIADGNAVVRLPALEGCGKCGSRGGCAGADQRQSRSPGNSRAGAHSPASHATGSGTRSGSRSGTGAQARTTARDL